MRCYIRSCATTAIIMMRSGIAIITISRRRIAGCRSRTIIIISAIGGLHITTRMRRSRCLLWIMMMLRSRWIIKTIRRTRRTRLLFNRLNTKIYRFCCKFVIKIIKTYPIFLPLIGSITITAILHRRSIVFGFRWGYWFKWSSRTIGCRIAIHITIYIRWRHHHTMGLYRLFGNFIIISLWGRIITTMMLKYTQKYDKMILKYTIIKEKGQKVGEVMRL